MVFCFLNQHRVFFLTVHVFLASEVQPQNFDFESAILLGLEFHWTFERCPGQGRLAELGTFKCWNVFSCEYLKMHSQLFTQQCLERLEYWRMLIPWYVLWVYCSCASGRNSSEEWAKRTQVDLFKFKKKKSHFFSKGDRNNTRIHIDRIQCRYILTWVWCPFLLLLHDSIYISKTGNYHK